MHSTLAVLGILVSTPSFLLLPGAQDPSVGPAAPGTARPAVVDDKTSIFGEPLYVNGKRVTDEQIKHQLVTGPCRLMVDLARVNVVIEDELRRRAAEATELEIQRRANEKPFDSAEARKAAWDAELENQKKLVREKVDVTEEQLENEINRMVTEFKKNYPALVLDTEVARAYRSVDWYKYQLRMTMLFDHVFLPENPDEWPVVTMEAIRQDSGDILIDDAKQSFIDRTEMARKFNEDQQKKAEEAKATGQEFTPEHLDIAREDPLYQGMLRDIVRLAVFRLVEFRTAMDGLPISSVLWADTNGDGQPELELKTEEVWDQVKGTVSLTEIEEAKQWFVSSIATRDRLEKEGVLPTRQDCLGLLKAQAEGLQNGIYDMEGMATGTYYFPSFDNYADYFCMLEGFKRRSEPDLKPGPAGEAPQVLRDYFDRANKVMGLGQIDVEVMLIGAFDVARFRWKADGWNWAKKKAGEIRALVDANTREYNEERAKILEAKARGQEYTPEKEIPEPYRFWTQMMDDHCEYWDPPAPNEPDKRISQVGMKMKGRFGPHYRNDLNSYVGETFYSDWLTGWSITDHVFFDQVEGTVAGPFRGPQGYYLTRVLRRTPPTRGLNLSEPKHLELLRDDWLRWKFNAYTRESVEMADVKGFARDRT